MRLAGIVDGVHRIQPESIEVKFLEPVERVVNEEVAHRARVRTIEVDAGAPRRVMAVREELRCVEVQIIAFGPEMVIDDVEQHHQAARVRGGHQRLEILGRAVGGIGREGKHAVVPPAPRARKVGNRHELDGCHPEVRQIIEARNRIGERAARRERADVQLVDHRLVPGPAAPVRVRPVEGAGVDNFARAVDSLRVAARCRIGHQRLAVDRIAVAALPACASPVVIRANQPSACACTCERAPFARHRRCTQLDDARRREPRGESAPRLRQ